MEIANTGHQCTSLGGTEALYSAGLKHYTRRNRCTILGGTSPSTKRKETGGSKKPMPEYNSGGIDEERDAENEPEYDSGVINEERIS